MLTVGDTFPDFDLAAVEGVEEPRLTRVRLADYLERWLVVFFWPKDFTFVCPTEVATFGTLAAEFTKADAAVLGVSTDNEYTHLAWRASHPDLRHLAIPMASDLRRDLAGGLGILHKNEGVALRASFIVDPKNTICFVSVNDLDTGRSAEKVLRSLQAIQAGGLTVCGWRSGDALLTTP